MMMTHRSQFPSALLNQLALMEFLAPTVTVTQTSSLIQS